jgi:DNA-binding LytR/AlgR family response regulator
MIVVTTAYKEYALKSFEFNVLDYLIKPISFDRLVKSINKIFQRTLLKPSNTNELSRGAHIFVKVNKKLIKINLNEVLYVESLKDYIRIHVAEGRYVVHKSLTSITEELPKSGFIRVHRSYTISIGKITAIEGNYIEISTKRIPIGRHYVKEVKKRIFAQSLTINNQL